jgi:hypothetical protein
VSTTEELLGRESSGSGLENVGRHKRLLKRDNQNACCETVIWINLALDNEQRQALLNTLIDRDP